MRAIRRHHDRRIKRRKIKIIFYWRSYVPKKPWHSLNRLAMTEPGWWVHEHMILPMRIKSNRLCRLVEKGFPPDYFLWPDGKKPHIYYW